MARSSEMQPDVPKDTHLSLIRPRTHNRISKVKGREDSKVESEIQTTKREQQENGFLQQSLSHIAHLGQPPTFSSHLAGTALASQSQYRNPSIGQQHSQCLPPPARWGGSGHVPKQVAHCWGLKTIVLASFWILGASLLPRLRSFGRFHE